MKHLNIIVGIVVLFFLASCEQNINENVKKFSIKGQIINVNNPTKYDGMHFYLEYNSYSQFSGTVIETVAEDVVSDSGRFDFTYESVPGSGVTIKCRELSSFSRRFTANLDLNPVLYIGDSSTLIITFNSVNPIAAGDTLFFRYNMPYLPQDTSFIVGPILNGTTFKIRNVNAGDYSFTHGRGIYDLIQFGNNRYKSIKIKGDPFVDSFIVNY